MKSFRSFKRVFLFEKTPSDYAIEKVHLDNLISSDFTIKHPRKSTKGRLERDEKPC